MTGQPDAELLPDRDTLGQLRPQLDRLLDETAVRYSARRQRRAEMQRPA